MTQKITGLTATTSTTSAAGPAERHELADAERVQQRHGVGDVVGDAPLAVGVGARRRRAVPRPGVGDQAQARLLGERAPDGDPFGGDLVDAHRLQAGSLGLVGPGEEEQTVDEALQPADLVRRRFEVDQRLIGIGGDERRRALELEAQGGQRGTELM